MCSLCSGLNYSVHCVFVSASFTSGPLLSCSFVYVCVHMWVWCCLSTNIVSPCHSWKCSCVVFICVLVCDNASPPRVQTSATAFGRQGGWNNYIPCYSYIAVNRKPRIKHRVAVDVLVSFKDLFQDPLLPSTLWVFVSRCFQSSLLRGCLK